MSKSRRKFLAGAAGIGAVGVAATWALASREIFLDVPEITLIAPSERIRIATIGMGIIGFIDTETALNVPGVELAAVADLYEGRRIRAKEVFGSGVDAYVDYREILARPDIDAVLICTSDHWHAEMSKAAMRAGKAVYCEKPMVKDLSEGPDVIAVAQETGSVFQVGSQFSSDALYERVRELIADGAIGSLVSVEARYNRNNDIGAWQYSIPTDASEETVSWDQFLGSATQRPFDPDRFFRWRNYKDYGTGMAGDLFVHLFTGINKATGSFGPTRVMSTGHLAHWKDGREVPDVQFALFNYPETSQHAPFTVSMQTNFVDGSGGGMSFRFTGSDGAINVGYRDLKLEQVGMTYSTPREIINGYNSVQTFSEAEQARFEKQLDETWVAPEKNERATDTEVLPLGYDSRLEHFKHWVNAIRGGDPVYQDAVTGYRAAAPALLANLSEETGRAYSWDPVAMVAGDVAGGPEIG